MNTTRNALQIVWLLLLIIIAGTLGYHFIEQWSLFDSLYMTVITLATVGYGETHPLTTYGAGKNGHYVLEELVRTKRKVVAVEKDPKKVQTLLDRGIPTIEGDASNDDVLRAAGIDRAIGLVTTLPEDKDNLFVVITARGLNPKLRIVAKVDDIEVREKFFRSGADSAVSAPYIGGLRMASEMIRPDTTTFLDSMMRDNFALRVDEVKIGSTTHYRDKSIKNCDALTSSGVVLVSLRQDTGEREFIFNPPPSTILNTEDTLIVIGNPEQLAGLKVKLSK